MALGKRKSKQNELFIATAELSSGPGHPFYSKLSEVLANAEFDKCVEKLCAPYYSHWTKLAPEDAGISFSVS